jgi:hypothetical protein
MSTAPASQNPLQETDLLTQFEMQSIPAEYREYYAAKRNNFFASTQAFPELWKCYLLLDSIFLREFGDLKPARDPDRMFPLLLYFNAHAKIRVSMELALSGCMAEARSILRDAVECVAHAHTMLGDPELQKTWLGKDDSSAALEAFKDAFERQKRDGIFKGLDELHEWWGQLSEMGAHATINAMCDRFVTIESGDGVEFRLNYCGVEPRTWATSLLAMLLPCSTMEKTLFNDFESRLKLDDGLMRMRDEFERRKERLRRELIVRYDIKPPRKLAKP